MTGFAGAGVGRVAPRAVSLAVDRRKATRYDIQLALKFRVGDERVWRDGVSLDLSNRAIRFTTVGSLAEGQAVELIADWPARGKSGAAVFLTLQGRVLRSGAADAVVAYARFSFRESEAN